MSSLDDMHTDRVGKEKLTDPSVRPSSPDSMSDYAENSWS